jgi:peptide/nickel transport system substrate-binding protein
VEELAAAAVAEMDPAKRVQLLRLALRVHKEDFGHIPRHQPMLWWAVRDGVEVKQRPDETVGLRYIELK